MRKITKAVSGVIIGTAVIGISATACTAGVDDYPKASSAISIPAAHHEATAPKISTAHQQALTSAKNYLSDGQGFSRNGLIQQLTSSYGDGFSTADATWAVDHADADWNAQAVISAKSYMSDGQGFSRQGLIDQLTSSYGSGFTQAQAVYAANSVGL